MAQKLFHVRLPVPDSSGEFLRPEPVDLIYGSSVIGFRIIQNTAPYLEVVMDDESPCPLATRWFVLGSKVEAAIPYTIIKHIGVDSVGYQHVHCFEVFPPDGETFPATALPNYE